MRKDNNSFNRETTPQPLLKYSLGPGSNIILKNSNIVITQNTISKIQAQQVPSSLTSATVNNNQLPVTQLNYDNRDQNIFNQGTQNLNLINDLGQDKQKSKKSTPNHQRSYSYEQKAKIYQQKAPSNNPNFHSQQHNTFMPNQMSAQNFMQQQQNSIGSRNQARFQKMQSTGMQQQNTKQAQIAAMLSNSYKHQQRKLSYSPVLKQTMQKSRKKPNQEELMRLPQRRAHSKTDKYNDDPLLSIGQIGNSTHTNALYKSHGNHNPDDSVDSTMLITGTANNNYMTQQPFSSSNFNSNHHFNSQQQQQNFLVQNSFDRQQQLQQQQQLPQRFSPLQFSMTNQLGGNKKRTDSRDHNRANSQLNRPSSATLKRKEQGKKSEDLTHNLRSLLQNNLNSKNSSNKNTAQSINNSYQLNQLLGKNNVTQQQQQQSSFLNQQQQQLQQQIQQQQKPETSHKSKRERGISNIIDPQMRSRTQQDFNKIYKSEGAAFSTQNSQNMNNMSSGGISHGANLAVKSNVSNLNNSMNNIQNGQQSNQRSTSNSITGSLQNNSQQIINKPQSQNIVNERPNSELSIKSKPVQEIKLTTENVNQGQIPVVAPNQQPDKPQFTYQTANPAQMYTNCVTKFAFATKTGMAPSNPNKTNQDIWITVPHFTGLKYCHFFSVCDGHGQYGREVSTYLKNKLPKNLENEIKYVFQKYEANLSAQQKNEPLNTDEICLAFNDAFLDTNDELFNGNLDVRFSGSTCVTLITLGQKLFCSNVGDSRGIVVKKFADGKTQALAISRDQKPCQPDEAERIIKCNGRIDSFRDQDRKPVGPLRVWLKNEDIPGLAMTRSFGDEVAGRVGVIAEPEILELDLCKDDKFIVLASDGVWEFLQNEDVAEIVLPFFEKRNAEGAAEALVRESYLRWRKEEEDIVDDITCVIIFLDVKLPHQQPSVNETQ
eukprot:403366879